jgi:alcohol dehydrogenase class IV
MAESDADVLVGIGGGSSLDVARQASVFAPDDRSLADLREEARDGTIRPPDSDGERPPVVVVPTTFAGADVSSGGSIEILSTAESPTDKPVTARGSAMPIVDFADPVLFETTPTSVLAGSAMNGFDKGIETPYARDANPVSDATAVHGLRLLSVALPRVAGEGVRDGAGGDAGSPDTGAMDRAVVGSLLVQFDRKVSIVHAFARRYAVQQGAVHAVVVPHVLRYLFGEVDASCTLLAEGLGIDPAGRSNVELADAIVDGVTELRDGLDVPTPSGPPRNPDGGSAGDRRVHRRRPADGTRAGEPRSERRGDRSGAPRGLVTVASREPSGIPDIRVAQSSHYPRRARRRRVHRRASTFPAMPPNVNPKTPSMNTMPSMAVSIPNRPRTVTPRTPRPTTNAAPAT